MYVPSASCTRVLDTSTRDNLEVIVGTSGRVLLAQALPQTLDAAGRQMSMRFIESSRSP